MRKNAKRIKDLHPLQLFVGRERFWWDLRDLILLESPVMSKTKKTR